MVLVAIEAFIALELLRTGIPLCGAGGPGGEAELPVDPAIHGGADHVEPADSPVRAGIWISNRAVWAEVADLGAARLHWPVPFSWLCVHAARQAATLACVPRGPVTLTLKAGSKPRIACAVTVYILCSPRSRAVGVRGYASGYTYRITAPDDLRTVVARPRSTKRLCLRAWPRTSTKAISRICFPGWSLRPLGQPNRLQD